ncbi:sterol desaturase family protein [Roseovarius confluentis]|uniref:sterol desaturase family protein n=1 Tax=Roseovarius confluentis TaxID=1852027 RepID=UPI003BABCF36
MNIAPVCASARPRACGVHLPHPLLLTGLPAEVIFFGILTVQAYQTWIHTELVGRLGPLDGILNTPSNHRVHHGCDDLYLDKNYGGILIIWDRIFGTYQREEHTPRYGLVRDFDSVNPLRVWVSELPALMRDITSARTAADLRASLFGRPAQTHHRRLIRPSPRTPAVHMATGTGPLKLRQTIARPRGNTCSGLPVSPSRSPCSFRC